MEQQKKRAGAAHLRIGTLEELKVEFVTYLKEEQPELLECKVKRYLEERGHCVLWTPPYCPELQPIELFWAAGKNHVALQYKTDTSMRDVVKHLREGWYGNAHMYQVGRPLHKCPVDCCKLWSTYLEIAGIRPSYNAKKVVKFSRFHFQANSLTPIRPPFKNVQTLGNLPNVCIIIVCL